MTAASEGILQTTLVPWLETNVGLRSPLDLVLIAGGRSNLTYRVTDAAGRAVILRRPPLGQVLATAHDMGREHRIISALGATDVPVPAALAFCDDVAVNGAPFYVMSLVDGHIVRDMATAEAVLDPAARAAAGVDLIEVLARIHAVDPDAVGLGELGRREGYVERQLKRWHGQLEHATSAVPDALHTVHDRLRSRIPEQGPATIVHGDYRLDNCLLSSAGEVQAVLDWELCTLGDPLADLGLLLVYWTEPDDPPDGEALVGTPTRVPGFATRDELVEHYAAISGRDLSELTYYVAFARWKLACVLQGVVDRYRGGFMGDDDAGVATFVGRVQDMADRAAEGLDVRT
jgi:aminoglycoside phosphotransferase (APT) family kinase protein